MGTAATDQIGGQTQVALRVADQVDLSERGLGWGRWEGAVEVWKGRRRSKNIVRIPDLDRRAHPWGAVSGELRGEGGGGGVAGQHFRLLLKNFLEVGVIDDGVRNIVVVGDIIIITTIIIVIFFGFLAFIFGGKASRVRRSHLVWL